MKYFILIPLFILLLSQHMLSQDLRLSSSVHYGMYDMDDLKKFQSSIYSDLSSSLDVPFKITDNFPGFFGYEVKAEKDFERMVIGAFLTFRTTGGRITYSDYSGRVGVDNMLKSYEAGGFVGLYEEPNERMKISIKLRVGYGHTKHELSSYLEAENMDPQKEKVNTKAHNLLVGPDLSIHHYLYKNFFMEAYLRYDLHVPGKLKQDKGYYLVYNYRNIVSADWSGVRAGMGFGLRLDHRGD